MAERIEKTTFGEEWIPSEILSISELNIARLKERTFEAKYPDMHPLFYQGKIVDFIITTLGDDGITPEESVTTWLKKEPELMTYRGVFEPAPVEKMLHEYEKLHIDLPSLVEQTHDMVGDIIRDLNLPEETTNTIL